MSIEMILKNVVLLLNSCHVLGSETENFAAAMKNIHACIDALAEARKEAEEHENTNEQGR